MWEPGDVVEGVYEVREVVRAGGMGLVYRVWHREWRMDLAVKAPRQELVASPEDIRRFEQEAEVWVGLGAHPHVVNCVYVRRIEGLPRVFAEWVDGGTLAEAVRSRGLYRGGHAAAIRELLDVAIQFAWGLEHAHRHGLIHRDVKPANVMREPDGTIKVTDFGLAKARPADAGAGTDPLASFGGMTPAYCSPEQARGERLTVATDVWSWAVSVLEMFVGRPPTLFGQAAAGVFERFTETGADDPVIPPMPTELAGVLRRCFTEDPSARPAGLAEIAEELVARYDDLTGERYPREVPDEAQLLADGFSNQALSMMDLGRAEEADAAWERALETDPRHPQATYNRGMRRWRSGRLTDRELIAELDAARLGHEGDWLGDYLLALAHWERGDKSRAQRLLRDLPDSPDVVAARAEVEDMPEPRVSAALGRVYVSRGRPFAISADGCIAAVTFRERELEVWSLDAERILCRLTGHDARLECVALSSDGGVLVSGDREGHVRVWDTANARCTRTFDLPSRGLESVAVSGDGTVIVTAGMDGSVRVLGDTIRMISEPFDDYGPGFGGTVTITADNQRVASFDGYRWLLRMWDLSSGRLVGSLDRLNRRFAFSANGRFALSATEAETLSLIDLDNYGIRELGSAVAWGSGALAVSDDGRVALSNTTHGVQRWQLDQPRCVFTSEAEHGRDLVVSADGRIGLIGLGDSVGVVQLPAPAAVAPWSYARPRRASQLLGDARVVEENLDLAASFLETGRPAEAWKQLQIVRRMPDYRRQPRLRLLWRQVGALGNRSAFAGAWRARKFEKLLGHGTWAITRDLRYAVTGRYDGAVTVYDLVTGAATDGVDRHDPTIEWTVACADDRHAMTTDTTHVMFLWDLKTAHRTATIFRSDNGDLELGPHRSTLTLVRGNDGTTFLWNHATRRPLYAWPGPADRRAILSGNVVITINEDGDTKIRDVDDHRLLRTTRLPDARRIVASADGRVVVAVDDQFENPGSLMLSFAERPEAMEVKTPGDRVKCLALTADGELLLTGADDRTLALWEVRTGNRLWSIASIEDISGVVLSADGCSAVSVEGINTVQRWELDWEFTRPE